MSSDGYDKDWARKYILDPLTAPEPNQETGLGSSHYNPNRICLEPYPSHTRKCFNSSPTSFSSSSSGSNVDDGVERSYPTSYPHNAGRSGYPRRRLPHPPSAYTASSAAPRSRGGHSRPMRRRPTSGYFEDGIYRAIPITSQPTSKVFERIASLSSNYPSHNQPEAQRPSYNQNRSNTRSLTSRFPGDMSHRPLDMIISDKRAAERLHRRRIRVSETDLIDSLDTIGGVYHHGGPYDATLPSRNLDPKTSPIAAVLESNMAALRATPGALLTDSYRRQVSHQGTSTIASGQVDYNGFLMDYEEGTDLLRGPGAAHSLTKRQENNVTSPDQDTCPVPFSLRGHIKKCLRSFGNMIRKNLKGRESPLTRSSEK